MLQVQVRIAAGDDEKTTCATRYEVHGKSLHPSHYSPSLIVKLQLRVQVRISTGDDEKTACATRYEVHGKSLCPSHYISSSFSL